MKIFPFTLVPLRAGSLSLVALLGSLPVCAGVPAGYRLETVPTPPGAATQGGLPLVRRGGYDKDAVDARLRQIANERAGVDARLAESDKTIASDDRPMSCGSLSGSVIRMPLSGPWMTFKTSKLHS